MLVKDGLTYIEQIRDYDYTGVSDSFSRTVVFNRKNKETVQTIDQPFKGFVKAPIRDFVGSSDSIFYVLGKARTFASETPASDRLLPFFFGKVLKEKPVPKDTFKRVWTIIRKFTETPKPADRPYKGFTPGTKKDLLSRFADSITNKGVTKRFKETALPLDILKKVMTFNRRFIEIPKPLDRPFKGFTPAVKKEVLSKSPEGPAYRDADYYATGYFADKYTELFAPIITVGKNFKDYAYTKDNLTIADGATYTDIKVLKDYQKQYIDRPFKGFTQGTKKEYHTKQVDKFKQTVFKVLKDSAIALDYLDIADRSTFVDVKVLKDYQKAFIDRPFKGFTQGTKKEYQLQLDKRITTVGKNVKDSIRAGDKLLPFTIIKRLFESPRAIEGPNRKDLEFYVPSYGDSQYLVDFALTVSTIKILKDTNPAFDRPFKGFNQGTRKDFNNRQVDSIKTKAITKVLKDYAQTKDNLTITDGVTFADIKILRDYQNVFNDRPFKASTKVLRDYQNAFNDKLTRASTKVLRDYAQTKDNLTIADGATYAQTLVKKETTAGIEGPSYSDESGYAIGYFADPYTELFAPIITVSKVLRDSARALDYIDIADRSTFAGIKILRDSHLVQADRPFKASTKALKDYHLVQVDSIKQKTLSKILREIPLPLDIRKFSISKLLKDTAKALDYIDIADRSTFAETLVKKDALTRFVDKRTTEVGKNVKDNSIASDRLLPFTIVKRLFESPRAIEGPNRKDLEFYVPEYGDSQYLIDFALTLTTSKVLRDYQSVFNDRPFKGFTKILRDYAQTKDNLTIADGATYAETLVKRDIVTKSPEGPSYQNSDLYATGYFADPYTELFAPIITVFKVLKDSAIALDYLDIADRSTFTEVKVLKDYQKAFNDRPFKGFNQGTRKDALLLTSEKTTTILGKVLRDSAIALDYLDIADRSTFADIKVLRDAHLVQVDRPFKGFTLSTRKDFNNLQIDGITQKVLVKGLKDYAYTKDNLTIADGATYAETLVKKETAAGREGPYYGNESGYATGYFADLYTNIFLPIFSTIKVLRDYQNAYSERQFKGFTKILSSSAKALDYLDISDRSTFSEVKVLKDYQTVQVDRIKQKTFNKVLKDYAYAIEDGGSIFKPMTLDPGQGQRLYPQDKSSFNAQKPQKETLFASDRLLPFTIVKRLFESPRAAEGPNRKDLEFYVPGYGDSQYLIDFALTVSISKVLRDTAKALDYLDIADKSTFADTKVLRELLTLQENIKTKVVTKVLKDYAYTKDNLTINDGATYSQTLVKKETVAGREGPYYAPESGYATGYFADLYTQIFLPIFNTIKVLKDANPTTDIPFKGFTLSTRKDYHTVQTDSIRTKASTKVLKDYAYTKDNLTIADGATYTDIKVLKDSHLVQADKPFKAFNQGTRKDALSRFVDTATRLIGKLLKDTAKALDYLDIADKSTFSDTKVVKEYVSKSPEGPSYQNAAGYAVGYFADPYTELFAPIKSINKVLKDYQIPKDGDFKDLEFYVPGYGEQTYLYDSFLAKSVTTIKRDYASKYKETGLVSYWNYTTTSGGEVFFATDYVGAAVTFSS